MNFQPSETTLMVRKVAADFAKQHIHPFVKEWDETQHFPTDLFRQMGEMGFMGVLLPNKYGGSDMDYHDYVGIIEEIAKVEPGIALSVAAHNSLCANHIAYFGSDEQKEKWLPKLASGEWIGAWALTEASAGSDAANMMTTAKEDGDCYVLNGGKNFITHAMSGEIFVVIARTGAKSAKHNTTAFAVLGDAAGLERGIKGDKMGVRSSETGTLLFDNCRVHKSQILGNIGEGFVQSMKILEGGRISIAALSLGIAKGAYKAALEYAKVREQFGKPISEFQAIAFKLADMETQISAAELLVAKASDTKNNGGNVLLDSAKAKLYASEVAVDVTNEALQIFGGYGYTKEYPVEKLYRDAKICTIGEGTSEIQRLVIARNILK